MCLGTFPHRARSSVTVCAFARYAHPDTRNISFSLNRICSEGNCQVLYRAATGVGFFSYVSPIGSGIMNLFPAVLIEYTKYFVKRIYSMSSKTKIIVLRMKEIIYTASNIKADEAYRIGLVNKVVPQEELMAAAQKMASKIASNAPVAVRLSKKAINEGLQVDMDKAIVIEEHAFGDCFATEDQKEGMSAFLEKRKEKHFQNK